MVVASLLVGPNPTITHVSEVSAVTRLQSNCNMNKKTNDFQVAGHTPLKYGNNKRISNKKNTFVIIKICAKF